MHKPPRSSQMIAFIRAAELISLEALRPERTCFGCPKCRDAAHALMLVESGAIFMLYCKKCHWFNITADSLGATPQKQRMMNRKIEFLKRHLIALSQA